MKAIIRMSVIVLGLLFSGGGFADELTESNVRRLIDDMTSKARMLDATGVAAHLSDDCQIIFSLDMFGQVISQTLTKAEYIASLKQGWATYEDYQFEIVSVEIQMRGDHAVVNSVSRESILMQGQRMFSKTHSKEIVRIVDGVLVVTKILGASLMSMGVET